MSTTKLFLIRHGQTDWNLAGKLQGHADIPLNATGKEQAQKVAQFLRKKQISLQALYSSDLQRAHQTAQEISKLFA
jgi:2,3-bisphosphoglycerate-dependent phosphoglycerate mutase